MKTSTPTAARFDLFANIHKALRFALCERLMGLGAVDFSDARAADDEVERIEHVLVILERHAELEDRFIRPALAGRAHDASRVFDAGHAHQACLVSEVRSLASAVETAPSEKRAVVGRTLYLHFGSFVAENLAHMAEEEQHLQPLLERLWDDHELRAIHARLIESMTERERAESLSWMRRASGLPAHAEGGA